MDWKGVKVNSQLKFDKMEVTSFREIPQINQIRDAVLPDELRKQNGIELVNTTYMGRPYCVAGFNDNGSVGYVTMFLDTKTLSGIFADSEQLEEVMSVILAQTMD